MSDLDTWWRELGSTLAGSIDVSPIRAGLATATRGAGLAVGGVSGGSGLHVHFHGPVGSERAMREAAEIFYEQLLRKRGRGLALGLS